MNIDIRNLQDKVKFDEKDITRCAEHVLKSMAEESAELSLLFVTNSYIKKLNCKYRNIDSATDVLAFPMRAGEGVAKNSPILGDVVISLETAKREAAKRGISLEEEVRLYLTHGILHLLGYDDSTANGRRKMKAKEKRLLEGI